MELKFTDYNKADEVIAKTASDAWDELTDAVKDLRLHLKASDQAKKVGKNIFDPIGTNAAVHKALVTDGDWTGKLKMPEKFKFLGKDIDFGKGALLVEAQFSNYPFLLNNLMRFELLYKSRDTVKLTKSKIEAVVILTKAGMFPASNSTLYYEQAEKQLSALAKAGVFTVPIRLVGLFVPLGKDVVAKKTTYQKARYSRTVTGTKDETVKFTKRINKKLKKTPPPEEALKKSEK